MRTPPTLTALTATLGFACCAPSVDVDERDPPTEQPRFGPIEGGAFDVAVDGDERVVTFHVPDDYDGSEPLPLALLLHGYGATGAQMDSYLRFGAFANAQRFVWAAPDGNVDAQGSQFWNATDACCDFAGTGVDDSAFLRGAIDGARAQANVDAQRVFVIGHSNGAFMAQRLACDHADLLAGVISVAGATTTKAGACAPSEPVFVALLHGTADETVLYAGGSLGPGLTYPSAQQTASLWAERDGCGPDAEQDDAALDLDTALAGAETTVARFSGCAPGGGVELWTAQGGTHIPSPTTDWLSTLWSTLLAHAKP